MIGQMNSLASGWWTWMFPMLWQTALLAGFVWALDLLLRRRGWPQVRYALWLLVFARLLVPPSFALPTSLSARLIAAGASHAQAPAVEPAAPPDASPTTPASAVGSSAPAKVETPIIVTPIIAPTSPAPITPISPAPVEPTPAVASAAPVRPVEPPRAIAPPPVASTPVEVAPAALPAPVAAKPSLSWKAWAMLATAGASALLLVWLAVKVIRLRRLAKRESRRTPVPAWILEMLARVAARHNLRRLPRIAMTAEVPSAAVCGIFRPVLFLPESSLSLPPEQMEHVLLHELAHLKRRDLLVNAVQSLLHIAYWFNPVLWLAGRRLRHLREICCDATVANLLRERTGEYSQTLVELADRASSLKVGPALGLLGLFESPSRLRQRIEYLRRASWKHPWLRRVAALAAVVIVIGCVAPMAPIKTEPKKDINAQVALLDIENAAREDVIAIFGKPDSYIWGDKTFSKDKLPDPYIMYYSRAFEVEMVGGRIEELRFEAKSDYVFAGGLRWGSTMDEVLKVMGPPDKTVEGGRIGFADGVLYRNAAVRENGAKVVSYYARRDLGVRIFAMNDVVTALYVTRKAPLLSAAAEAKDAVRSPEDAVKRLAEVAPKECEVVVIATGAVAPLYLAAGKGTEIAIRPIVPFDGTKTKARGISVWLMDKDYAPPALSPEERENHQTMEAQLLGTTGTYRVYITISDYLPPEIVWKDSRGDIRKALGLTGGVLRPVAVERVPPVTADARDKEVNLGAGRIQFWLTDKDGAEPGMIPARLPPVGIKSSFSGDYERARKNPIPDTEPPALMVGRLKYLYSAKDEFRILKFARVGNKVRIEIAWIPDKLGVAGDKCAYFEVNLRTPIDLPPGRYEAVAEMREYERHGDKIELAPPTDIRLSEHLTCTFTIPATAAPATGAAVAPDKEINLGERRVTFQLLEKDDAEPGMAPGMLSPLEIGKRLYARYYERARKNPVPETEAPEILIGRMKNSYSEKDEFRVLKFARTGNKLRIEIAYIRDIMWGDGKKCAYFEVSLGGPIDLPPGRYEAVVVSNEYEWHGDKIEPAAPKRPLVTEQLACTFTVPPPAGAAAAPDKEINLGADRVHFECLAKDDAEPGMIPFIWNMPDGGDGTIATMYAWGRKHPPLATQEPGELIGRMKFFYSEKGEFRVLKFARRGNKVRIEIAWIPDPALRTGVAGDKCAYFTAHLGAPIDLPPGRYDAVADVREYERHGDKIELSPPHRPIRTENLTGTFTIPPAADAAAAPEKVINLGAERVKVSLWKKDDATGGMGIVPCGMMAQEQMRSAPDFYAWFLKNPLPATEAPRKLVGRMMGLYSEKDEFRVLSFTRSGNRVSIMIAWIPHMPDAAGKGDKCAYFEADLRAPIDLPPGRYEASATVGEYERLADNIEPTVKFPINMPELLICKFTIPPVAAAPEARDKEINLGDNRIGFQLLPKDDAEPGMVPWRGILNKRLPSFAELFAWARNNPVPDTAAPELLIGRLRDLYSANDKFRAVKFVRTGNKVRIEVELIPDRTVDDRSKCVYFEVNLAAPIDLPPGRYDVTAVVNGAMKVAVHNPHLDAPVYSHDAPIHEELTCTFTIPSRVERREVKKLVSAFPADVDLSTPDSACAAFIRALARADAQGIADMSYMPVNLEKLKAGLRAPAGPAAAAQRNALLESEILTVFTREDFAIVVSNVPVPEERRFDAYHARRFGRVDGKWKNVGENAWPSLDKAVEDCQQTLMARWKDFEDIRAARTITPIQTREGDDPPSRAPEPVDKGKAELMGRVEDFFAHNGRDITARKTLEWGDVTTDEKGNRSIRYKYLATVWDKEKMIGNDVFTFDAQGKFVSARHVEGFPQKYAPEPADTSTQDGLKKLVEKFFSENFRDITARETIEWGQREGLPNGNLSIRYKYYATIRDKDHQIMNQVFIFDPKGEFVSWKNVEGFPQTQNDRRERF